MRRCPYLEELVLDRRALLRMYRFDCHVDHQSKRKYPITEAAFDVSGRTFRARWKDEELDLEPPVDLTAWLDLLLTRLSDIAMQDANLRRSVLRSGWALR